MSKKKKKSSTKVTVKGFNKPVDLKKKILKPFEKGVIDQTNALRPGEGLGKEGEKSLKGAKKLIKSLASDGKLGTKDLAKIENFMATTPGGKHFGESLRTDAFQSTITTAGYNDFIKKQNLDMKTQAAEQTNLINKSLDIQLTGLRTMLGSMKAEADTALTGFKKLLERSDARADRMFDRQQDKFARQNAATEKRIDRYQSRIASLPKPPKKTKQISNKINEVSAGDPFESIAQRRAPIQVQTSPAFTGFNLAQQESQARQMQGLSGFRSSRA
jgi:hypothetical protein